MIPGMMIAIEEQLEKQSEERLFQRSSVRVGRRGFVTGLATIAIGVLSACSSSTPATSNASSASSGAASGGSTSAPTGGATVKMTNSNQFDPATLTIAKGTTVTWDNISSTAHTATFDPSKAVNKADAALPAGVTPFDSGMIQPGTKWSHAFAAAGTYKYFCIPHESMGMLGTITVT